MKISPRLPCVVPVVARARRLVVCCNIRRVTLTQLACVWMAVCLLLSPRLQAAEDFAFLPAIAFDEPAQMHLLDITRAGDRLVAVGERGLVIISDDHGRNWRQADVPVSIALTAVHFPRPDHGWVVGHAGTILHSADGGESWTLQLDGNQVNAKYVEYTLAEVERLEQALMEATDESVREALELALEDATFAAEDAADAVVIGPADPFLDVLFTSAEAGFAVGAYGMLYRTADGGANWDIAIAGIDNAYRYHYYDIASAADGRLYLSGEAGLLYYSGDNGITWERVEGVYDGTLFGVLARAKDVLAFGLRGHIFRSLDGGRSWVELENPGRSSFYGGTLLEDGNALLVGAGGTILVPDTESRTVQRWQHPSRATLSSAVQNAQGDVLLVGMGGLVPLAEAEPL
ncbi:WD40/YVTN/BNR-like repeat-containing protein [Kineobactrum sediminis]|uniref:WD40/YVTN/BNR-like repeat-containing protein n=1 Tax=Kineobactrum sediminis TaxID=1905677 RepID=UPI0013901847|nr:YCF48-related protein [Kineobactrum sediminis]